ncbi:DUF368 domain-containing protein [Parahaliea sp. F7430]|uniref:DUF368 domain-containing protein n=2 Tax=Sediminihaliea albiluteola TaxID=2758564 RepID=A0A7W2YIB6_9GAMM|nr:DUF368 domain-containing protein [Sediminihaliea albiluteola]
MGAADIVPGVSGGTMAFITGIYDRLLAAIKSFDLALLRLLLRARFAAAWKHVDALFLVALLLGIATSMLSLARLVSWLLESHPVPLWAFFFGLILASALVLLKQVGQWTAQRIVALLLGISVALAIALSPAIGLGGGMTSVFFAGFIAICAMILPGISGSFILVLLGMYAPVLMALRSLDLLFILVFATGAASGLMCFSRLLHYLLEKFHSATMALLTGFLFGSLLVVWPWKRVESWIRASDGEMKPVQQFPVMPAEYLQISGENPQLLLCIAVALLGALAVWLIDRRWGESPAQQS